MDTLTFIDGDNAITTVTAGHAVTVRDGIRYPGGIGGKYDGSIVTSDPTAAAPLARSFEAAGRIVTVTTVAPGRVVVDYRTVAP